MTVKKVKMVPSQNIHLRLESKNMALKKVGLVCSSSPLTLHLMNLLPSMPILTNHLPKLAFLVRLNSATWAKLLKPNVLHRGKVDPKACLFRKATKAEIVLNLVTRSTSKMKFSIRPMNSILTIHPPSNYHLHTFTRLS